MKKKAIIFFPYHFLAYSPTTLNLYNCLSKDFDTKIVAPEPTRFDQKKPNSDVIVEYYYDHTTSLYVKVLSALLLPLYNIISLLKLGKIKFKYSTLKQYIKYDSIFKDYAKSKFDAIIVVDILFLSIASKYMKNIHFLSLELTDELIPLLEDVDTSMIKSVIIQSEDRYTYLFPERNVKPYFIQNSVFWDESFMNETKKTDTIIFCGTGSENFGIFYFTEFIRQFKGQYKGIIKGTILPNIRQRIKEKYSEIIESGDLIIDESYSETDKLIEYVSEYEIGICFYDIDKFSKDKFNYLTAPSGKMFTYFAAGVPVIGSSIRGLDPVLKFNAGVLINNYSPDSIMNAVKKIKSNYLIYKKGCQNAAAFYSFDRQASAFINSL